MGDTGVILPQGAAAGTNASAIPWRAPAILRKFRATLVTGALVTADVAAVLLTAAVTETIGNKWADVRGDILTTALLFAALAGCSGLYTVPSPTLVERLRLRIIVSTASVGMHFLISAHFNGTPTALVLIIVQAILLVALGHYFEMAVRSALMRTGLWSAAAVVVNCSEKSQRIVDLLLARPEIGLEPIGFVSGPEPRDSTGERSGGPQLAVFSSDADLAKLDAQVAVFTSQDELARAISRTGRHAALPRLLLIEDTSPVEREVTGLRPCMIGSSAGFEVSSNWSRAVRDNVKRAIDLCVAVPLALIALPVTAILAGVIVAVSPGSPFYRQERVGRGGTPIQILKLRTMHADAERRLETYLERTPSARAEWERFFKLKYDPRILGFVGTFIRRSSLDELPQIWNILRGDMTLVGPRPFPAYHVRAFDADFQALRATVKPGLTGLWQVSFRSNGDLGIQKAQDSFYINNWSIWLDLYILLQTLPAVLRGDGAR
jgi:Undecaprenyl-phosphate galactose phosphotransferase WbaP